MKALCWCGTSQVQVEQVADPKILDPRDVIVRTTATTICGTDLHIYDGYVGAMQAGDILGHELVGEVVEVGPQVKKLKAGNRVVVSPVIACGECWFCKTQQFSLCDNSNPNAALQEKMTSFATAGVFGFSHAFGGYAGCQAEFVRVPFADVGAIPIPDGMDDRQALACSDVFPTGFMGADIAGIRRGDVVAVWGCGPVGQFAIKGAKLLGAERVFAIDKEPARLRMAAEESGAETLDNQRVPIVETLRDATGGRGPDVCIDAVGMEAHGSTPYENAMDRLMEKLLIQSERLGVVRDMIYACRKGGTMSTMGVYAGTGDRIPLGVAFSKGLRWVMGNMHGPKYIPRLFEYWELGRVDPGFIFTHEIPLTQAPDGYRIFRDKERDVVKILLRP